MKERVIFFFQLGVGAPFFTQRFETTEGAIFVGKSVLNSMYNAMVLTVRKPTSHGFEILANYTLATASDDTSALIWDVLGGRSADWPSAWDDLASDDGRRSFAALASFANGDSDVCDIERAWESLAEEADVVTEPWNDPRPR